MILEERIPGRAERIAEMKEIKKQQEEELGSKGNKDLDLQVFSLEGDISRIKVVNWPDGLTYYTDKKTKQLTRIYTPRVVVWAEHYDRSSIRIGKAFPPIDRSLEAAVLPIISISKALGEFVGLNRNNLNKPMGVIEYTNYHLKGFDFETHAKRKTLEKAVKAGYLRKEYLDHLPVYFPTEKTVGAMCNNRFEDFIYSISLHTGVAIGTGHRRPPRDFPG